MKLLAFLSSVLILSGCASNKDYSINGVEPGDNQALKVVGMIVVTGVIAKSLANKNCTSTQIRNNNQQVVGTINNC